MAGPDAIGPSRRFLYSKSKGWLPATARARVHTHFAVDYVTPGTYDSGTNPKWVCSGVEARPPPRLHFPATRQEAGSFPARDSLHHEQAHRSETMTLGRRRMPTLLLPPAL